jgi:hypothetical protein
LEFLYKSDLALKYLVDKLDELDRKVLLVFFGDHFPGLYWFKFTDENYKLGYKTPLLYYANFPLPNRPEIGIISPNYLNTVLLDVLGAQKPAFYYLLDELKLDYPQLTHSYYRDTKPQPSEVFSDYELINYDILSGKCYSVSSGFFR